MNETQQRIGDYAIIRKIGEGGMGAVYLATDMRLGRKVALKTMKAEFAANKSDRDRFEREARAAAAVEHDNIVPIWGIGEAADGTPFLAMPFLQGESLDARMNRSPVASLDLLLKVAREVSDGLAAAHAKGLIHRDIKPGNIWLEGDLTAPDPTEQLRRCKILDFGLARSVSPDDVQITASGVILGTPAYMAPEQARGENVDHRADLFSLGVMLYRMATGQPPFNGPTPMAVLIALTTETPAPVGTRAPHLPRALAELIDRLMCKDPTGRPQSAKDVSATVRRIATDPRPAPPAAPSPGLLPTVHSIPNPVSTSAPYPLPIAEDLPDDATEPATAPVAKRSGRRWVVAAAVGLLALVPLGLLLSGALRTEKPDPNAGTKNGDPKPPENGDVADPDRKAAEYILSTGSPVYINEQPREYRTRAELPREAFRLTFVNLAGNPNVTDAGLADFRGCKNLSEVDLTETPVTDAGLIHFEGGSHLNTLGLDKTAVTDSGLVHLAELKNLKRLSLTQTQVTAKGVAELAKALPLCDIKWDGRADPVATDPDRKAAVWALSAGGSVQLNGEDPLIKTVNVLPKDAFRLTAIYLTTPMKDGDWAAVAGCKNLTLLHLSGTGITNAGLAQFKECKDLTTLDISGAKGVTDDAVAVLKQFAKLTDLAVIGTEITEKGAKELAKAVPGCRIQWNGGGIEPATEADRKAAEWVFSMGGYIWADGSRLLGGIADLPKESLRLRVVYLDKAPVIDADLARFKGCNHLTSLYLSSCSGVTDGAVGTLKQLKALTILDLRKTAVTTRGINELAKALPKCKIVHDGGTIEPKADAVPVLNPAAERKAAEWVRAVGGTVGVQGNRKTLEAADPLPKGPFRLTSVDLKGNAQATDTALAVFKECTQLEQLDLVGTPVTDTGLNHFTNCRGLKEIILLKTKVTQTGIDGLAQALPGCKITWDKGLVEPAKK